MLTKNFYSYMRAALQKTSATFTRLGGTTESVSIAVNQEKSPFAVMNEWSENENYIGVAFGAGTIPATASDYALESILNNTKISATPPSAVTFSQGDAFDEYSVSFGVTNITDETITISEVGLVAMPYKDPHTANSACIVLVDRTVLDAPVTIPANETKHIAYTIRFNY